MFIFIFYYFKIVKIKYGYFIQVVDVDASQITMYGTKVEIKMKKAEPGSWSKLGTPVETQRPQKTPMDQITPAVEAVNLDDL